MLVFHGEGCPHCDEQAGFLDSLEARYPALRIERYEIWRTGEHHALFRSLAQAHGVRAGSVPSVFIGGEVLIGDSPRIRAELLARVVTCLEQGCADPREQLAPVSPAPSQGRLSLPGVGDINLANQPLLLATVLIAVVDGFNPCSLWVLTLLLALVVQLGSRARVLLVGITFLVTTAAVYGLFILGLFGTLAYVLYHDWVRWAVAVLAAGFALINIKDYFWFRQGPSLTIPDSRKPWIYRRMRALREARLSIPAVLGATVVMALGIALVELPCTAGFPVVWSSLVAAAQPTPGEFAGLLGLYLLVYLGLELVVLGVALVTLRMGRLAERHGQVLKLVGGVVMLALAGVLVLAPALMNELQGVLLIFLAALAVALVTEAVMRRRQEAGRFLR
ncbi:MAG: thioredoxin [Gammaproteobacteria bacterium]|nr:MAG: thioredoxin [Gammaproteobacteria bacterium]